MSNDLLTGKHRTSASEDKKRIESFVTSMLVKMASGKEEHGADNVFNPVEEAMDECVDIANYAMVMYFRLDNLRKRMEEISGD